jgi:hypothetical protein
MHSGKGQKHSGKPSPSATLGEEPLGMPLTGKRSSPSAKSLTLGEDVTPSVSFVFFFGKPLPQVQHSGKKFVFLFNPLPRVRIFSFFEPSSPSAPSQALGEEISWILFLKALPRVPLPRHLGKPLFCFSV